MNRWFEVFVDNGEAYGTETVETFNTLQEAKEWISVQEDMGRGLYYIDEWERVSEFDTRIVTEHDWLGLKA